MQACQLFKITAMIDVQVVTASHLNILHIKIGVLVYASKSASSSGVKLSLNVWLEIKTE